MTSGRCLFPATTCSSPCFFSRTGRHRDTSTTETQTGQSLHTYDSAPTLTHRVPVWCAHIERKGRARLSSLKTCSCSDDCKTMKSPRSTYVQLANELAATAQGPPPALDPLQPEADALLFAARSRCLESTSRLSALKARRHVIFS